MSVPSAEKPCEDPVRTFVDVAHGLAVVEVALASADNKDAQAPDFEREHIFLSFIHRLAANVSKDEKMAAFFLFWSYQKALKEAQSRHLLLSDWWLRYANAHDFGLSQEMTDGMEALLTPVLAYHDYAKKDFDHAIQRLERSIELLGELEAGGLIEATAAKVEQVLNLFKASLVRGEAEAAIEYGADILSFMATARVRAESPLAQSIPNLLAETPENRTALYGYHMDAVLSSLLRSSEYGTVDFKDGLGRLCAALMAGGGQGKPDMVALAGSLNSVAALRAHVEDDGRAFFRALEGVAPSFARHPGHVRFLLLTAAFDFLGRASQDESMRMAVAVGQDKALRHLRDTKAVGEAVLIAHGPKAIAA